MQRKRLYLILIGFIIIVIGLNVFWLIKFKQSPVKAGMMPNTSSQITNNKEKQRRRAFYNQVSQLDPAN